MKSQPYFGGLHLLVLGGFGLLALTGCVGHVDGPRTEMYGAPSVVQTGTVFEDDFIYYPNYQIYYSQRRHQYAYLDGPNWVYRSSPRGVSRYRLRSSPSVPMDFHDSPGPHHQNVLQQYPKNWSPATPAPGHQDMRPDDRRDHHGR
jgi:hypothetical protein